MVKQDKLFFVVSDNRSIDLIYLGLQCLKNRFSLEVCAKSKEKINEMLKLIEELRGFNV